MQVVRAADCRRMPWKNGGGETAEIAVFPEGAGLDAFVWRLSTARVARDGPFSLFPGIDRTLAVLSGEGLELRSAGGTTVLRREDAPLFFAGDDPVEARLSGGAIEDLNIMTRRGAARHRMERIAVRGPASCHVAGATVLAFCAEGSIGIEAQSLHPGDTALLFEAGPRTLAVDGTGTLYLVEIDAMSPSLA